MRSRVLLVWSAIAGLQMVGCLRTQADAVPPLEFQDSAVDLGSIVEGSVTTREIPFTAWGVGGVRIAQLGTSCSCIEATIRATTGSPLPLPCDLRSGERAILSLTLVPFAPGHNQTAAIRFDLAEPGATVFVHCRYRVCGMFDLDPPRLDLGPALEAEGGSAAGYVGVRGRFPFQVLEWEDPTSEFQVLESCRTAGRTCLATSHVFRIGVKAGIVGNHSLHLLTASTSLGVPLRVPIYVTQERTISVRPQTVLLRPAGGADRSGDLIGTTIVHVLTGAGTVLPHLDVMLPNDSGLRCEIVRGSRDNEYCLSFVLPASAVVGPFRGTVSVGMAGGPEDAKVMVHVIAVPLADLLEAAVD